MRKIVIAPTFASNHLLKCWLQNIKDSINPDVIILNEGLFPNGPENKGHITPEFKKKWCYTYPNTVGFDWEATIATFTDFFLNSSCKGFLKRLDFDNDGDANKCFLTAISAFDRYEPEVGDIIFPLEPDAFFLESDKSIIDDLVSGLKPGDGLSCKWVDFLETQYYTELINIVAPKYRRLAYCFDTTENYKKAMDGFMTQNYSMLTKIDSIFIRHYCWFQPEPYKQLRFDLIYRSNPKYWEDFDEGLQIIRSRSEMYKKTGMIPEFAMKTELRPSRNDEGRWATFIDVKHPEAIKNHPNYVT